MNTFVRLLAVAITSLGVISCSGEAEVDLATDTTAADGAYLDTTSPGPGGAVNSDTTGLMTDSTGTGSTTTADGTSGSSATGGADVAAAGKAAFTAQKCSGCHAVESAGVSGGDAASDLSRIGAGKDAEHFRGILTRAQKVNGVNHPKAVKSEADLTALANWMATLK